MKFTDAVAAEELWGWPVATLDHLLEVRSRAWRGEISLEEWRVLDSHGRAGLPALDLDEIRRVHNEWIKEWVRTLSGSDADGGDKLIERMTPLLHPAPTDEALWNELAEIRRELGHKNLDRRTKEAHHRNRFRVAAWLTRPGSGIDPITGLPWARIAQYRVIDDPDLGPIPQYLDLARKAAEEAATADERERAELVRENADDRRFALATAELQVHQMSWLPALLSDAAEDDAQIRPLLTELKRIWADERVQRLLLAETSQGWPAQAIPENEEPGALG